MSDNAKTVWKSICMALVSFLGAIIGAIFGN